MEDCIFCKIVAGEVSVEKVYEDENFLAFPDVKPQVEGHTLIIPKKHFVNIMDLPSSLGGELVDAIKKVAEIKMKEGFEGFSLIMNNFVGQAVMHAHVHLLPRKEGDGFKLVG